MGAVETGETKKSRKLEETRDSRHVPTMMAARHH